MGNSVSLVRPRLQQLWSWILFVAALAVVGGCFYLVDSLVLHYFPARHFYWRLGMWIAIGLNAVLIVFNEPLVCLLMECRLVRRREQCPELWDAVHQARQGTWLTVTPRIYLVDDLGCNAFAFGWGLPFFSAVAATRGIVDELDERELRGVMAHELAHIANKDILCAVTLTVLVGTFAAGWWILWRAIFWGGTGNRSSSSSKKGGGCLVFLALAAIALICFLMAKVVGPLLQLLISRQREYAADWLGAHYVDDAEGLASALEKIAGNTAIRGGGAVNYLCFQPATEEAARVRDDLFATHPHPRNRINALRKLSS